MDPGVALSLSPCSFRPFASLHLSLLSCAVIFAVKALETKDRGGAATCEVMLPSRTQLLLCV
jgi:hypothetical protein